MCHGCSRHGRVVCAACWCAGQLQSVLNEPHHSVALFSFLFSRWAWARGQNSSAHQKWLMDWRATPGSFHPTPLWYSTWSWSEWSDALGRNIKVDYSRGWVRHNLFSQGDHIGLLPPTIHPLLLFLQSRLVPYLNCCFVFRNIIFTSRRTFSSDSARPTQLCWVSVHVNFLDSRISRLMKPHVIAIITLNVLAISTTEGVQKKK